MHTFAIPLLLFVCHIILFFFLLKNSSKSINRCSLVVAASKTIGICPVVAIMMMIIIHLYSHIAHPWSLILLWKRVSFLYFYTFSSFFFFLVNARFNAQYGTVFQQRKKNSIDISLYIQTDECLMNPRKWECMLVSKAEYRSLLLLVLLHIFFRQILGNNKFCSFQIIASRCAFSYPHTFHFQVLCLVFTLFYQKS